MTTDVLILGAGSAGCILANRLSADPARRVTLVEAGGFPTDPDIFDPAMWPMIQRRPYDWDYRTVPQPDTAGRVHHWARGRMVGGSSGLHAMFHLRGHPADFDRWGVMTGDAGWSYDALLPHFRATEGYATETPLHGARGEMPVTIPEAETHPLVRSYIEGWQELGLPRLPDHNGREVIGAAPNALMIRDGRRVTTGEAFLRPVLDRPNLTVITGAEVHRLRIAAGRVTGVEIRTPEGDTVLAAGQVILSMGTIGDPLLLMRSGVGDPGLLAAAGVPCRVERRALGRNLHDHMLGAGVVCRARRPVAPSRLQHSESLAYQSSRGLDVHTGAPDIVVGCVVAPSVSECFPMPVPGETFTLLFGVTHPTSRGELAITGPDLADVPRIDPRYLSTDHDRTAFRTALDRARMVAGTRAMRDWNGGEILPGPGMRDLDAFIQRAAITHHHPVATCAMGASDDAVVRPDLSLRGLDNVSVVDASVIPAIPCGPIHAAVMAIAQKFAAGQG
ncbi:GMC family oxidoreductase [Paenirhodobacter populi]|uniref:GMC family oxidoreductase n=1 Tax=Paenirhodobacter populi TaxID=2306993 RepID=UPI000FE41A89|nr:GMC family oxidoreductase N-terminal domain-containing protein [Sinirhodobacter populi]RWR08315.1 pyridoxine 4-oxidase [Sinirhodobacter populi]